jgi:hypothetical protein
LNGSGFDAKLKGKQRKALKIVKTISSSVKRKIGPKKYFPGKSLGPKTH